MVNFLRAQLAGHGKLDYLLKSALLGIKDTLNVHCYSHQSNTRTLTFLASLLHSAEPNVIDAVTTTLASLLNVDFFVVPQEFLLRLPLPQLTPGTEPTPAVHGSAIPATQLVGQEDHMAMGLPVGQTLNVTLQGTTGENPFLQPTSFVQPATPTNLTSLSLTADLLTQLNQLGESQFFPLLSSMQLRQVQELAQAEPSDLPALSPFSATRLIGKVQRAVTAAGTVPAMENQVNAPGLADLQMPFFPGLGGANAIVTPPRQLANPAQQANVSVPPLNVNTQANVFTVPQGPTLPQLPFVPGPTDLPGPATVTANSAFPAGLPSNASLHFSAGMPTATTVTANTAFPAGLPSTAPMHFSAGMPTAPVAPGGAPSRMPWGNPTVPAQTTAAQDSGLAFSAGMGYAQRCPPLQQPGNQQFPAECRTTPTVTLLEKWLLANDLHALMQPLLHLGVTSISDLRMLQPAFLHGFPQHWIQRLFQALNRNDGGDTGQANSLLVATQAMLQAVQASTVANQQNAAESRRQHEQLLSELVESRPDPTPEPEQSDIGQYFTLEDMNSLTPLIDPKVNPIVPTGLRSIFSLATILQGMLVDQDNDPNVSPSMDARRRDVDKLLHEMLLRVNESGEYIADHNTRRLFNNVLSTKFKVYRPHEIRQWFSKPVRKKTSGYATEPAKTSPSNANSQDKTKKWRKKKGQKKGKDGGSGSGRGYASGGHSDG
jgi:hypothetical protein